MVDKWRQTPVVEICNPTAFSKSPLSFSPPPLSLNPLCPCSPPSSSSPALLFIASNDNISIMTLFPPYRLSATSCGCLDTDGQLTLSQFINALELVKCSESLHVHVHSDLFREWSGETKDFLPLSRLTLVSIGSHR